MHLPITVLVQTKNEATGIATCLKSLNAFDEVIVVDSNSTDNTVAISLSLGAAVINFSWDGRYPKKKQWQLDTLKPRNEWVLFLDADEIPTKSFTDSATALLAAAREQNIVAFDLQLLYVFDGRTLKHGHRITKRALVRPDKVRFPVVDDLQAPGMGELEGHYQPIASGGVTFVPDAIRHDDKDPVRTWFDRHNRYSDWETYLRSHPRTQQAVGRLRNRGGRIFDRIPGRPIIFFAYSYIIRNGFRDGTAGLNYALALSFYYWQINLKVREARRAKVARS